eukprot:TRINITY_DN16048_c0_g1_i1.p1 TRINITY_DN16048_c0_g1~~TRINITY_DN16048_c0_g1_i1.p1  ORF type:complete len:218 (-),score=57.28 TRINITY_DN16048_c0_g1_i1:2-586(-)
MEINVMTSTVPIPVTIDRSSNPTVLTVKEMLYKKKYFPITRQTLYFQGYRLDDDELPLSELGDDLDGSFTLVMPKAAVVDAVSAEPVWLTVGTSRSFRLHMIPGNRQMRMTLNQTRIGIVYQIESESSDSRKYHLAKYTVSAIDTIQIRDGEHGREVVFMKEGKEVDIPGTMKVYDEHSEHLMADLPKPCRQLR